MLCDCVETGTALEKQIFRERREYVHVGSRKNILFFSVPENLFSIAVPPYGCTVGIFRDGEAEYCTFEGSDFVIRRGGRCWAEAQGGVLLQERRYSWG
jgi:hypothetical protein